MKTSHLKRKLALAALCFSLLGFQTLGTAIKHEASDLIRYPHISQNYDNDGESKLVKFLVNIYARKGLCKVTTSPGRSGNPYSLLFDGNTSAPWVSEVVNPVFIQIEFNDYIELDKIRILPGQPGYPLIDKNDWWVEIADTEEDLNNKIGSYNLLIPKRTDVAGVWDEVAFASTVTTKIVKFHVQRTVGDQYVHIQEIELWGTQDAPAPKSHEYVRFNNLIVLYKNSNHGSLPGTIENDIQIPINTAEEFYFRNSHMSFLPVWTVYVVEEFTDLFKTPGNHWIPPNIIDNDLRNRGFPVDEYDCIYIIVNGSNNGAWGANRVLGRGGYFQTGWWGSDYGKFVMIHEFDHIIDFMFDYLGYKDFPFNHPVEAFRYGEFVPNSGGSFDYEGEILRFWQREKWLSISNLWGEIYSTPDMDNDGLPDNDPRLPFDELRLGSSAEAVDTDNDGLTDLEEAMAGKLVASDLTMSDSDGDGIADMEDKYPLYPLSYEVSYQNLNYKGVLSSWPLMGNYFYDHPEHKNNSELRLAYDQNYLYIGIKVGSSSAGELILNLDCNADGVFYGKDNLEIYYENGVIKNVLLKDATRFQEIGDVDVPISKENYFGFTAGGPDWKTYQLAIPRQPEYGLDLEAGEEIGLAVKISNYGNTTGSSMFEPGDYFNMVLEESNTAGQLFVNAKGTAAGGVYAHFKVLVDGLQIGDAFTSSSYQSYAFPLAADPTAIQQVEIVFDNDAVINGKDRNLYVQSIELNGEVIQARSENVTYTRKDGKIVNYSTAMWWNGTLLFEIAKPQISVTAKGTQAGGTYAHFRVYVNDTEIGNRYTTSVYQRYDFPSPLGYNQLDEVKVVFDNDAVINGKDRNLYVQSIAIGDNIIPATKENVIYIRKNGSITNYYGAMWWNGDLLFDVSPANARLSSEYSRRNTSLEKDHAFDIVVFPNPNDGKFYLKFGKASDDPTDIILYDVSGKVLAKETLPVVYEGEIRDFSILSVNKGIYFINFLNNNTSITKKITIR